MPLVCLDISPQGNSRVKVLCIPWQCWPSTGCSAPVGKTSLMKIIMIPVASEDRQSLCGPADAYGTQGWSRSTWSSSMFLVTSLLHLSYGFIGDFLRASSGMAASSPERERVIIWPRFGCSWLEQRAQEIPENLGWLSLQPGKRVRTAADATGRSYFPFPMSCYHLTYSHSPSPVEYSFTDFGAIVTKISVSWLFVCTSAVLYSPKDKAKS